MITHRLSQQPMPITSDFQFIIDFVLRELLNNAVEHGNGMIEEKRVRFKLSLSEEEFQVDVWDEGAGFAVTEKSQNIDNGVLRTRNRGIQAIRELGFMIESGNGRVSAKTRFETESKNNKRVVDVMEIQIQQRRLICNIKSNLIAANIKALVLQLKPFLDDRASFDSAAVSLEEVKNIDSTGITFLIGLYKSLEADSKKLVLYGVSEPILRLLKIMKLDEIFNIYTEAAV